MLGCPRSTLCMASRAPRIVDEGVADARPLPDMNWGSAAASAWEATRELSFAMWMICKAGAVSVLAECAAWCGPLNA